MNDLDLSCGGLLPLIPSLEASPSVYDDRSDSWLTRSELRAASLNLAKSIASEEKRLIFLLCGVNSETIIGLLAAAAAGHATALVDPLLPEHLMTGLIQSYQPDIILGPRGVGEKLPHVMSDKTRVGSAQSRARRYRMDREGERIVVSTHRSLPAAASVHIGDNRQPEIRSAVA